MMQLRVRAGHGRKTMTTYADVTLRGGLMHIRFDMMGGTPEAEAVIAAGEYTLVLYGEDSKVVLRATVPMPPNMRGNFVTNPAQVWSFDQTVSLMGGKVITDEDIRRVLAKVN